MTSTPAGPAARHSTYLPQLTFVTAAAVAAWVAFADHLPLVVTALAQIGVPRTATAIVLVVLGLLATARMWRANLTALGHRLPATTTYRVFFPAQVGKYLPGAVWPYLAQLRLIRTYGVPARATLTASTMFLAMHVSTGIALGAALLAGIGAITAQLWWLLLLAPPALALLQPRVIVWIAGRLPARGETAAPSLGWPGLARSAGWMLVGWLCYGAAGFVTLTPFVDGPELPAAAVAATGAFAVGWVVGLVTIVAPAGIGAREATFALLLTPLVGAAPAVAVALLLRLCHLAADLTLAAWFGIGVARKPARGRRRG